MVRYPQKDDASDSKKSGESSFNKSIEDASIQEVKQLHQKLLSLEEQLRSLQRQNLSSVSDVKPSVIIDDKVVIKNKELFYQNIEIFFHRYKISLLIMLGFCVALGCVLAIMARVNVVSVVFEIAPKQFIVTKQKDLFSVDDFLKFQKSVAHIQHDVDGRFLNARMYVLDSKDVKQSVVNWQKSFVGIYVAYRQQYLQNQLGLIDNQRALIQDQRERVVARMSTYKPNEHYFLVNLRAKNYMAQLCRKNALIFEKDLMSLNDALAGSYNKQLLYERLDSKDKFLIDAFRLKLTEVEFQKYLIASDFLDVYEQGVRVIKAVGAQEISSRAHRKGLDDVAVALVIKHILLTARQEALEAVLNKRYVVDVHELSSHLAAYVHLKSTFEELNAQLTRYALVSKQIHELLSSGLSYEIVIHNVCVSKYHLWKFQ